MSSHSKYPHGHAYDLFVSYSSHDLEWVQPFHEDLVKEVNRWTAPDIYPFLDRISVGAGDVWDPKIMGAVQDSAILVPVMSPRFFASEYCQKEVTAFVEAQGVSGNRIMPVVLLEAAAREHVLIKVQATDFSRKGLEGIHWQFKVGTSEYQDSLTKLSHAIAKALQNLTPKSNGRAAIFLARDFSIESEKLRASLSHHFEVLPSAPREEWMQQTAEELEQALERDFARSIVSIHRLGPAGALAKPLIDAQLEFARKHSQKPRLVWTAERPDELTSVGFEWFTSQAEIEERIRRLQEKPGKLKANGNCIYFLCPDAENGKCAEPLLRRLKERGLNAYISPMEGEAERVMQEHVNLLDEADGCLIYYGDVERSWFDGLYPRLKKKIRQRGLRTVIYNGPPPNDHKRYLQYQDWPVVEDFDAAAQAFLEGAA